MEQDIQQILITEEQLRARIEELGRQLTQDYAGKNPVIVGVLKGVVVFYADMVRQIKTPCQMDFMWISSYEGTSSTGEMVVKRDVTADLKDRSAARRRSDVRRRPGCTWTGPPRRSCSRRSDC